MTPELIDIHAHLISPTFRARCESVGILGGIGEPLAEWHEQSVLEFLDAAGIRTQVLSFVTSGFAIPDIVFWKRLCRESNEELAEIVSRNSPRFAGLAMLPIGDEEACLRELEYALDILKLDGVALPSNAMGVYLGDPCTESLFQELSNRRALVHLHPNDIADGDAHTRPNWFPYLLELPFDTTRAVANLVLSGTMQRNPNVNVVLAHAGGAVPFLAARLQTAVFSVPGLQERLPQGVIHELRRFYYDVAMSTNDYAMKSLCKLVSADHILLGTDYPYMPAPAVLHSIALLEHTGQFTDSDLAKIKYENAQRLLPIMGSSGHV